MAAGWGGRVHTVKRSMNAELHEGSTDGKYKKFARNRGGVVEGIEADELRQLNDYYHVQELPVAEEIPPVPPFLPMRG